VVQLTNGAASANAGYQYDSAGRLWQKTYGNGDVVTHAYDQESRLLSLGITNNTTLVTCYAYGWDAGGNILAITNNGTNITLYGYDRASQLTNEVTFTNGIAGAVTNSWQYDEAGNWLNAPGNSRWRYNPDNELTARSGVTDTNWSVTVTGEVEPGTNNNKWYNSWAYCRGASARVSTNDGTFSLPGVPLYGGTNILIVSVTDVSGNTYVTNRTVIKTNLEAFLYDCNGNLTNWVSGTTNWVYEWDWADRLTKVTSNGVVLLQNWYDANSQRLVKRELVDGQTKYALYIWDDWDSVAVLNQSAQVMETFTRGVGLAGDIGTVVAVTYHPASGQTPRSYYPHHNHRGDVVVVRGIITRGTYEYSAFGSLKTQTGTDLCRFKFSSKEREMTCGFYYYGYRFYAPQWQRWPVRDPLLEEGGVSLYHYVHSNPVMHIDPYGLDLWIVHDKCSYFLGVFDIGHSWVVGQNGDGTFWDGDLMPGEGPLKPLNCPAQKGFNGLSGFNPNNLGPCYVITRHVVTSPVVDRQVRDEAQRRAAENTGRYDLVGNNCRTYANSICDYAVGAKIRELIEKLKKDRKCACR
jgi:RHS repeat-associated protein